MSNYEKAKGLAEKILELEKVRKTAQDDVKVLKDELLEIITTNSINSFFEFPTGLVFLDRTTTYKIADGLKEETKVTSKSPDKISPDFVEEYFTPDVKLNKAAKKAIREESSDLLLSVLVPEEKQKIKVTLS